MTKFVNRVRESITTISGRVLSAQASGPDLPAALSTNLS